MSTLAEIESAAEALTVAEMEELLLFIATYLRRARQSAPQPRVFSPEQIREWIAEDEADLKRLHEKP